MLMTLNLGDRRMAMVPVSQVLVLNIDSNGQIMWMFVNLKEFVLLNPYQVGQFLIS